MMQIDIKAVKEKMEEHGIKINEVKKGLLEMPEGWSNTLIDVLEELYDLETKLVEEFRKDTE
jgi:hypothetical protein